MEVRFTPEREAQFAHIAGKAGTDPEHLVKDAALPLLGEEEAGSCVPGLVVAEVRVYRAHLQPDPEGWTTRDYILYGRR
jgi:hypothetical protein